MPIPRAAFGSPTSVGIVERSTAGMVGGTVAGMLGRMLGRMLGGTVAGMLVWSAASPAQAAPPPIVIEGEVPDSGPDHFFLEFEVAPGVAEIEVSHDDLSEDDILDWGLEDPAGFRGWGGGSSAVVVVNAEAATPSYLPGPITPGLWRVVVGKAKIVSDPASYKVIITQRDAVTLAPQTERQPYVATDLGGEPRWLAGDFHVHSRESGDAQPTLDTIAEFARGRGLDFVLLSDHNTVAQHDYIVDAQGRHPDLLFIPGMEFTTYDGHANAIGLSQWVDHKIGQPGITIEGAAQAIAGQGAIFSINHPAFDLGDLCIGCGWAHELPGASIGAVEIATGGLDKAGQFYTLPAIEFWDQLCAQGLHIPAVGGSDDHKGGVEPGFFSSPIGDPTTLVFAETLAVDAILDGVRAGRTVVKLQGPDDPMVELVAEDLVGDTIIADQTTLTATVRGGGDGDGDGIRVRFVVNGEPMASVAVTDDPFVHEAVAVAPLSGEDRWRAEVLINGKVRTITSHLWLREDPSSAGTGGTGGTGGAGTTGGSGSTDDGGGSATGAASTAGSATASGDATDQGAGCTCTAGDPEPRWLILGLLCAGLLRRRR